MSKFKVLKYNQAYMTPLGIYSNRLTDLTNENFKSISWYFTPVTMLIVFVASATYIASYPSDIKGSLGALKMCFGAVQCGGMFFGVGIKLIKMKELHGELQQIADQGILCNFESFVL